MDRQPATDERAAVTSRDTGEDLWMILAVIQPFRLDAVTLALETIPGFAGMTVTQCRGFGREKVGGDPSAGEGGRGDTDTRPRRRTTDLGLTDFTDKVRLEIAVAGRERVDTAIKTIAHAAHTGNRGDGKVFAWPIARALRVRTLEEGSRAL